MEYNFNPTSFKKSFLNTLIIAVLIPGLMLIALILKKTPPAIPLEYIAIVLAIIAGIRFQLAIKRVRFRPVKIILNDHSIEIAYMDRDQLESFSALLKDIEITSGSGMKNRWIKLSSESNTIKMYSQPGKGFNYQTLVEILEEIEQKQNTLQN